MFKVEFDIFWNTIIAMVSLEIQYSISSYSFHKNYSFLNLKIVGNQIVAANFNFLLNKLNYCEEIHYQEIWIFKPQKLFKTITNAMQLFDYYQQIFLVIMICQTCNFCISLYLKICPILSAFKKYENTVFQFFIPDLESPLHTNVAILSNVYVGLTLSWLLT